MKLCKNCRHAEPRTVFWKCHHPQCVYPPKVNVVTGRTETHTMSCESARSRSMPCDEDGKLWEPIKPEQPVGFV
jgi:hypothetical protein